MKKLTYEIVSEKAKEFTTTGAFRTRHGGYVRWAQRNGYWGEISKHMKKGRQSKWTMGELKKVSSKYTKRRHFQDNDKGAYLAALNQKVLDEVCLHMDAVPKRKWNYDKCKKTALKFNKKEEFSKAYRGAFVYASRHGFLDEICEHMGSFRVKYTVETIKQTALNHSSRGDFARLDYNTYMAACRIGMLNEVCSHMEYKDSITDNDCVYIWKLVGENYKGVQLYKIGVTSVKLGDQRIRICASSAQVEAEIIIMKTVPNAIIYERELLTFGVNPNLKGFDGCTEVRALTDDELDVMLSML